MSAFRESINSILSLFSSKKAREMFEKRMEEEQISESDQKVICWVTFFRRNPHIFVEYYLGLELYLFQKIMIYLMFKSNLVVLICARNISKTFTTAVFAVSYCILYPNSKVLIGSYTKGQAGLIVSEKIDKELMTLCPILEDEILKIVNDQKTIGVRFHNGSNIFCTVVGEQARGYRSTVCVIDEYRLTDKEALSNLIIPTMMIRNTPYMKKERYNNIEELQEQPREIYLTSAYYKSNWYYKHSMDALVDMYKGKGLLFSTDYALCLKHGIKTREQLIRARRQATKDGWDMEYCNIPLSISEDAFYPYRLLDKAQCLTRPFVPPTSEQFISKEKNAFNIPKAKGEKRILAMDIAMSATTKRKKNDYSSVKLIRAIPSNGFYERREVYAEEYEGKTMLDQTKRIRYLMRVFDVDMVVFDAKNFGINFVDEMAKPCFDEELQVEYPALRCWNIEELSERCRNANALPLLYGFMGDARKNHNGHMAFKSRLKEGNYKMLCTYLRGLDVLKEEKDYNYGTIDYQAFCESAFIQSDATVNEMVQLETEFIQGSYIKLVEPNTGTKDKYMASMMGNYYIQYELDVLLSEQDEDDDEDDSYVGSVTRVNWY